MGTPPTETATGGARSAASPAAAGARSPNPTQLAAAASASRTRIGILQFSRKGRTTKFSSGGRVLNRNVTRNQDRGRRLLQRLVRPHPARRPPFPPVLTRPPLSVGGGRRSRRYPARPLRPRSVSE